MLKKEISEIINSQNDLNPTHDKPPQHINSAPEAFEVTENAPYDFIYRMHFQKIDSAAYISHLDLVRTMTRAIRRARLPIWYTEGFNRHPYLTFAAPLSLGFEGLCETMDLRFIEDISENDVVSKLNEVLPAGLKILNAAKPIFKAKEITSALYEIEIVFKNDKLLEDAFSEFKSQEDISAEKLNKKKKLKIIPLKAYVDRAELVSKTENSIKFVINLPCGSTENINPNMIVSAFFKFLKVEDSTQIAARVIRHNLFAGKSEFK